ncbi:MAG: RES domain-containing protein [Gammaproteobacteria bacterium]|nr:RES domain-containing protein [Gammaproteobacteria bacterium]
MLRVWRLVTARFIDTAFSGEGARRYGGRWNKKGVPLVYTAGSQSLAMLEMLVQDEPLRARYVMIAAEIPTGIKIDRITLAQLPTNWRNRAALEQLRTIGSAWALQLSSAVLEVPSAVVPAEANYLLNPKHPDYSKVLIGEPQTLVTDLRLLKT